MGFVSDGFALRGCKTTSVGGPIRTLVFEGPGAMDGPRSPLRHGWRLAGDPWTPGGGRGHGSGPDLMRCLGAMDGALLNCPTSTLCLIIEYLLLENEGRPRPRMARPGGRARGAREGTPLAGTGRNKATGRMDGPAYLSRAQPLRNSEQQIMLRARGGGAKNRRTAGRAAALRAGKALGRQSAGTGQGASFPRAPCAGGPRASERGAPITGPIREERAIWATEARTSITH